jgi:hypothetical protein
MRECKVDPDLDYECVTQNRFYEFVTKERNKINGLVFLDTWRRICTMRLHKEIIRNGACKSKTFSLVRVIELTK